MDELKLSVVLAAIDRATRPMRAISSESGALSKALRKNRDDLAGLNALQQRITGFKTLKNDSDATRQALAAATQRINAIRTAIAAVPAPTAKMTLELERAERAVEKSRAAHINKLGALRRSREALQAAGISTAKLADHERELAARIGRTNTEIAQQSARLRTLADAQRRAQRAQEALRNTQAAAGTVRGAGASAMVGGAAVAAGPLAAIRAASEFEQAMLGVARQVEGARDANGQLTATYHELGKEIQAMSQRLPMASTEIAHIVTAGARMGIQGRENLLAFAETTAIAANAFDLPADEIGDNLARVANLYKIPIKNIGQLGDTINWLDDQALAKGGDIIDVLQRMGDVADRMDYRNAAAFGSTFLSLGAAPEIAASATKALVRELSIASVQPKKFQGAMAEIGLNSADVQKRMAVDASKTIMDVLERINAAAPDDRISLATRIFGKEFGDDAGKLALNLGELRRQIALTTDAQAKGSMGRENEARLQTLQARWVQLKNQLYNTAVTVGTQLAPTMIALMTRTGEVLTRVQAWVQQNPQLAAGLAKVALAGGALLTIAGGLSVGVSALMGPFAWLRYGVTALATRFGPLMQTILPLARNAFPMLMQGVRLLLPLLGGISAPMLLVGAAIAAVGLLIYKYWQPIKAFMSGVFQGIGEAAQPVFAELGALLSPLKPVWDGFVNVLGSVWGWFKKLIEPVQLTAGEFEAVSGYGRTFGATLTSALLTPLRMTIGAVSTLWKWLKIAFSYSPIGMITNNWDAIMAFFTGLWPRMKSVGAQIIDGLLSGITSKFAIVSDVMATLGKLLPKPIRDALGIRSPSRVFEGIGVDTVGGLTRGINARADLPVRAIDRMSSRVRAAGEAVARGRASGSAAAGRAASGGTGASGGGGNHYAIYITVPNGDPQTVEQAVRRGIAEAERAKQSQRRSRLTDSGD